MLKAFDLVAITCIINETFWQRINENEQLACEMPNVGKESNPNFQCNVK